MTTLWPGGQLSVESGVTLNENVTLPFRAGKFPP
jgi:hypothetical protein